MGTENASKDFALANGTGNFEIPIWRKYILSVQEASDYFHIGYKKLRKIIDENPNADFILWNGTRPQIKRKLFEKYIDEFLSAI
nr:excisionase [Anaerobium acetethylicum]